MLPFADIFGFGIRWKTGRGNLFLHLQLLPDDLHQHPLSAAAVEFTVVDLLPRAKVELPFGDGDDDFPAHDLPFQVGIGVVLPRPVVMVVR